MTEPEPSRVVKHTKCPKCGGALRLFPVSKRLHCEACGDFELRGVRAQEWRVEKARRRLEAMRRKLAE